MRSAYLQLIKQPAYAVEQRRAEAEVRRFLRFPASVAALCVATIYRQRCCNGCSSGQEPSAEPPGRSLGPVKSSAEATGDSAQNECPHRSLCRAVWWPIDSDRPADPIGRTDVRCFALGSLLLAHTCEPQAYFGAVVFSADANARKSSKSPTAVLSLDLNGPQVATVHRRSAQPVLRQVSRLVERRLSQSAKSK